MLCAGYIIPNGDGSGDGGRSDGNPYSRGLAQHGHEALEAAACLSHSSGKLTDACGNYADAFGDFRKTQHHRAGCGSNGGELHQLHALSLVHIHELVQQLVCALDQVVDGGIEIVAKGLSEQHSLVLQVGQLAGSGSIPLSGFFGQCSVFIPCFIGGDLRFGEQLVCVDGAEQRIAQTYFDDADLLKGSDGAHALVIHLCKALDERLKRARRISVPQSLELFSGHAGHLGKIIQRLAAGFRSNLHFDESLGESGTAHLSLNAD